MALGFTIVLGVAIALVAGLAGREVVQYFLRRPRYLLRRLTIRLCMAGMLIYLLASILVGVTYFGLAEPVGPDPLWMAFWGCIGLLTLGILCLVLADFRLLSEESRDDARALLQDISTILAAHGREERKDG